MHSTECPNQQNALGYNCYLKWATLVRNTCIQRMTLIIVGSLKVAKSSAKFIPCLDFYQSTTLAGLVRPHHPPWPPLFLFCYYPKSMECHPKSDAAFLNINRLNVDWMCVVLQPAGDAWFWGCWMQILPHIWGKQWICCDDEQIPVLHCLQLWPIQGWHQA